jgi:hypothetical protein
MENYQKLIDNYREFCFTTMDEIFVLLDWLTTFPSPADPLLQTLCTIQERHFTFLMENVTSLKSLRTTIPLIDNQMKPDSEDMEYAPFIDLLNIS